MKEKEKKLDEYPWGGKEVSRGVKTPTTMAT